MIPLALAIVISRPTKISATIASVLATPLRLVIVAANLLLLLLILSLLLLDPLSTSPPTELQDIIAQAVRMAGNASLSTTFFVLPGKSQT